MTKTNIVPLFFIILNFLKSYITVYVLDLKVIFVKAINREIAFKA